MGTITLVGAASGGNRIISGTLANQGTIDADSNDYLEITGTYQAQGGTTTGPAELFNCKLAETASPASPSTIVVTGTGDTLASDNLAGYTIWVNGNGLFNTDAILNLGATSPTSGRSCCSRATATTSRTSPPAPTRSPTPARSPPRPARAATGLSPGI